MPRITAEFTEEELAEVRAHAASLGKSVRAHARDVILAHTRRARRWSMKPTMPPPP